MPLFTILLAAIDLYRTMQSISRENPKMDDQIQLLNAVESMNNSNSPLNISKLPEDTFQCGRCYFEDGERVFAGDNPCEECVVVHNNWIVTKEAKRYRAREHHHWYHDWGQYYSNPNAKYLVYDNNLSDCTTCWHESEQRDRELKSLQNALAYGRILRRIVILPAFHCGHQQCALNSDIKISDFDKAFDMQYREHTFLQHPKVPDVIKNGLSEKPYFIKSQYPGLYEDWCTRQLSKTSILVEVDQGSVGLTDIEIRNKFESIEDPVLHFTHMQDTFAGFVKYSNQKCFDRLIGQGFTMTDYRQQQVVTNWFFDSWV